MTSTGRDAEFPWAAERLEDRFERSGAHQYFQEVEAVFLELRGGPLTLGSKDYALIKKWYEEGVPLALVRSTLREVLEKRKKEGKDRVSSLRYVKSPIERAWKRYQEVQAPGAAALDETLLDVPQQLEALVQILPSGLIGREALVARIKGLSGDAESVEESLAAIDGEFLAEVWEDLPASTREQVEGRLAKAREKLARKLPREEVERATGRLRDQLLREELSLPVLSLFSVDP